MEEYPVTEVMSGSPLNRSDKTMDSVLRLVWESKRSWAVFRCEPRGFPPPLPPRESVWAVLRLRGHLLSILAMIRSANAIASAMADSGAGEGRPERFAPMRRLSWQVDCRFRESLLDESRIQGCRCRLRCQRFVILKPQFVCLFPEKPSEFVP